MRPLILLLPLVAGCLPDEVVRSAQRPPVPPTTGLILTTGLIELPPGDPYLTAGLWADARDPLPHERSAVLARNGLRVGVLSGIKPARFDALTADEGTYRHVTHRTLPAGAEKVIPVNGPLAAASVTHFADLTGTGTPLTVTAAECGLSVVGEATADGVRLRLLPVVQHGEKELAVRVAADGTLGRDDRRKREAFPGLAVEVVLGDGDVLVVGGPADPGDTLGRALFLDAAGGRVRQRVLVVRADR
jgi:hypothetical protein